MCEWRWYITWLPLLWETLCHSEQCVDFGSAVRECESARGLYVEMRLTVPLFTQMCWSNLTKDAGFYLGWTSIPSGWQGFRIREWQFIEAVVKQRNCITTASVIHFWWIIDEQRKAPQSNHWHRLLQYVQFFNHKDLISFDSRCIRKIDSNSRCSFVGLFRVMCLD